MRRAPHLLCTSAFASGCSARSSSGSLAMPAAIRRAWSGLNSLAVERRAKRDGSSAVVKSPAINSVRRTIEVMLSSRPWRSLALLGAFAAGGCAYQLNSLGAKSGADTGTSLTGRPKPPEVDLAYVRAVVANAFARGGKDNNTPWQNPNTGAGGNITPLATSYVEDTFTCHDFLASYVHVETETWLQGAACRTDNGKWQVKNLRPLDSR
jgi:surface antigen